MSGKAKPNIVWPEYHTPSRTKDESIEMEEYDFDAALYDRLKDLREKLAKKGGVPSYHIFPNKTLEHFTRLRPKTHDAGCRIKGVGAMKAERYLNYFIDEINRE